MCATELRTGTWQRWKQRLCTVSQCSDPGQLPQALGIGTEQDLTLGLTLTRELATTIVGGHGSRHWLATYHGQGRTEDGWEWSRDAGDHVHTSPSLLRPAVGPELREAPVHPSPAASLQQSLLPN